MIYTRNKKAALDKKRLFILIGFVVIIFIVLSWIFNWLNIREGFGIFSSVPEQEAEGLWGWIMSGVNYVSNYTLGVPIKQAGKNFFGFQSGGESFINFWPTLVIGLFAGLIMWVGTFIIRAIIKGMDASALALGAKKKDIPPIDLVWLDFLAGGFGRVLIIGITYAALMQVAIINRFIELITFYNFTPFWVRPFVLAVYVGYLPAAIEGYLKWRNYQKMYKYNLMMKAGKIIQLEAGRI